MRVFRAFSAALLLVVLLALAATAAAREGSTPARARHAAAAHTHKDAHRARKGARIVGRRTHVKRTHAKRSHAKRTHAKRTHARRKRGARLCGASARRASGRHHARSSGKRGKGAKHRTRAVSCRSTGKNLGSVDRRTGAHRKATAPSPVVVPAPAAAAGDPFAGERLFVEPNSEADRTEQEWNAQGRSAEAAEIGKIATQPEAKWFGDWSYGHGSTEADVSWWVGEAAAAGALPLIVAYDLPWRDCGSYSSGGASSPAAYRQFIEEMAQGIGGRRAAVIVEPDALSELSCLNGEQQSTYYSLLNFAVGVLGANAATAVYLDAGNAGWQPAATMTERLSLAGVSRARGFSLNVSNFDTTASETSYGETIATGLHDGSHFVIDTSRNARGPAAEGQWCNPQGRGLGTAPTAATGNPLIDAFLWIKRAGESDGSCNGGPAAGEWWPAGALELAENAVSP